MDTVDVDAAVHRWVQAETLFAADGYSGRRSPAGLVQVTAAARPDLVLVAPHAVNHTRDGAVKRADRGTGGLAVAVAGTVGCWAVAVAGHDPGDAAWPGPHPLHDAIAGLWPRPRRLLDLHGMRSVDAVDIEVGTAGVAPEGLPMVADLCRRASAAGLQVRVNERFDATRPGTVTSRAADWAMSAIQVELSERFRLPEADTAALHTIVAVLLATCTR